MWIPPMRRSKKQHGCIKMTCCPTYTTIGCNPSANNCASDWRRCSAGWRRCSREVVITPAGIRHATRLVGLDPLCEAYYQTLMRLHVRNHDRSSALRVYHQCMRNLQRELGVSPSKETQDIFMQALKSEDLLAAQAELPPYAATRPPPLVGRKAEWERLVSRCRLVTEGEAHFVLIMGEPGIGKTRLAEALLDWFSRNFDCTVARGRCYFAQGQLAYGPVTELLRADPMRVGRAAVAQATARRIDTAPAGDSA